MCQLGQLRGWCIWGQYLISVSKENSMLSSNDESIPMALARRRVIPALPGCCGGVRYTRPSRHDRQGHWAGTRVCRMAAESATRSPVTVSSQLSNLTGAAALAIHAKPWLLL